MMRPAEQASRHVAAAERRARPRDAVAGEPPRSQLVSMIVGTYREMPGLQLRVSDAARLFGLRSCTCHMVLEALVESGQLRRIDDGSYVRA